MEIKNHQFTSVITHQSRIITLIKKPKRNINMKFNININFFALFRQITPAIFARPLANSPDHLEVGVCQDHLRAGPVFQGCFKGNVPWKTMVSPWKNMVIWLRIKWCVLVYHWLSHIFGVNILIHIEVLTILQDIHVLFHATCPPLLKAVGRVLLVTAVINGVSKRLNCAQLCLKIYCLIHTLSLLDF